MLQRDQILRALRKSGGFVSGEELSRELDVSRTSVWKCINALREEGYEIHSVTNRGYHLTSCPDIFTPEEIGSGLGTARLGGTAFCFESVGSTNEEAKRQALSGAPGGSLFIAEQQTGGKGRLGRSWASPPGTGMWFSLLLRPGDIPEPVTMTTLLAGLAVCRAIREKTGCEAMIKWPNDIVIGSRKVCGILTEMSAEIDRIEFVVVGIGLNVNIPDFPADIQQKATSLLLETGHTVPRVPLLQDILRKFETLLSRNASAPDPGFLEEYKLLCVSLGRTVKFTRGGAQVSGTAVDVSPQGELIVRLPDGSTDRVFSGEVSVQGIYGE